jgi:uncharacterized membrane protein YfcA
VPTGRPDRQAHYGERVTLGQQLLLLLAGIGAGVVGFVAGLASLVSYPVLLAVGLPPLTANLTNTVALVASRCSGSSGRPSPAG